ncbi:acetyl-CoA carboxylase biotin carboxyl carrier protein [Lentzea sp. NPDC058436]|uniref:acetyl-CoA carboxylase biotin carboxyl carrier protein n=1 Tax=Lentzea sp. NPDC058436 TaxID=3346499 RepID=UPI00365F36DF
MTTWAEALALVTQLEESGVDEAEVVAGGMTVRYSRSQGGLPVAPESSDPAPVAVASGLVDVTAPMLGVAHLQPAPGKPPFVRAGDTVEPDSSVAIVEVMKMMNTVTAGVRGRVVEVVVEDGALVQHGTVLMRVEPA